MSEVRVPYGRPEWMKAGWYSGELTGGVRISALDFVRDRNMDVKFEIRYLERIEDTLSGRTFRNLKLHFYKRTTKVGEGKHSIESVCAAIEICEYSVWRKGKKIWPVESEDRPDKTDSLGWVEAI